MRKTTVALALTALIAGCGEGQPDEAPPGGFLNTRGAQSATATPDGDDDRAGGGQAGQDPSGDDGGEAAGAAGQDGPVDADGSDDPDPADGGDDAGDPGDLVDGDDPEGAGDVGDGDDGGPEAEGGPAIETDLPGLILSGPINGPIIGDAVLVSELSPYDVQGVITVGNGARLSIEPGTVIRMARGAAIIVGDDDHGGALSAVGTADAPIIFTSASANPQPGDWGLIAFMDKTQDAVTALRHVTLEYAGQPDVYNVAGRRSASIAIVDSRPAIADCTVRRHQGYGVEFIRDGGANVFQSNTFADGELAPIAVPAGQWSDIGPQESFDRSSYVEVTGGTVTRTFEIANLSVPWRITGDIAVKGPDSPVLHIPAGAELQMGPETSFDIGDDEEAGGFVARGTEDDPIVFTSASAPADPGDWGGIAFRSRALDEASTLEHVTIEYAGGEGDVYAGGYLTAAVGIHSARPSITHTQITDSGGAGVEFIGEDSGASAFRDNRFAGNAQASIRIPASRSGEITAPLTFEDAGDRIEITYGQIGEDVTWQAHQAPWRIVSQMPIEVGSAEGVTFTVEPGTRIETLHAGGGLRVGGNEDDGWYGALRAEGTRERPIVFTSADRANPQDGDWGGIIVRQAPRDGESTFEHVIVEYGGSPDWAYEERHSSACLVIANTRPDVTATTFRRCQGGAIDTLGAAAGFGTFDANTFIDTGDSAVTISAERSGDVAGTHTFQGERSHDHIAVRGGVVSEDTTWTPVGAPWRVEDGELIEVGDAAGATLRITAGVTVQFGVAAGLHVGAPERGMGDLIAVGEPGRPVLFTSGAPLPAAGDWRGVLIDDSVRDDVTCMMEFVVEYAGAQTLLDGARASNIVLNQNTVELRNGRVRASAGVGIWIVGGAPTLDDIDYDGNRDGDWVRAL